MEMIPLSFLLGFYVTYTANRWWDQYKAIPWPDRVMNVIMMYVPGLDDGSRMLRRTLMRYLNLSLILVLRSISKAVKRRFPTKDHLVEAGFMTKVEVEMWQSIPSTEFNTFWVPCTWFVNLLREARNECRITDAQGVKLILEEFNDFRAQCGLLWSYDWISIPLVYTQVVTLATYSFFCAAVFGTQYISSPDPIINSRHHFDFYVPIFTVIQYFLYMGLLKVAEQLINPFGDDDEDFELNWIIDRHIKVSYLGVDTLNGPPPPLVRDSYFHKSDYKLPYTAASVGYKKKTYRGSVAYMHVPHKQQGMVVPEMSEEDEEDVDETAPGPLGKKPSLWTLRSRRGSTPRGQDAASAMEGGLFQQGSDDSTLHVYFRGATPTQETEGIGTAQQETHLLQVPDEKSSQHPEGDASPDTNVQADTGTSASGKSSFIRDLFFAKNPSTRAMPWTGADGNYESPPKQVRRPQRSKVTFCPEVVEEKSRKKHAFSKFKDCIKSRSTSDLSSVGRTKDGGTLRGPLATSSPKTSARLGKRKASLASHITQEVQPKWQKCSSLPSMAFAQDMARTSSPSPPQPKIQRPSVSSHENQQSPTAAKAASAPHYGVPLERPLPMLTFSPRPPALPAPPPPERRRARRDSLVKADKGTIIPEPPKPIPEERAVKIPLPPVAESQVSTELSERSEYETTRGVDKEETEPERGPEPQLTPPAELFPSPSPPEPPEPPELLRPPEPGPAERSDAKAAPELSMTPQEVSKASSSPSDDTASDESADTEFVVLIRKGDHDKPKRLVILPTMNERASSMESLSSPVEAHLTLPLQKSSSLENFPKSESSREREKSRDTEDSDSESLKALIAAAPVHRRVPCEVLMKWQNVAPVREGTTDEFEKPRTREGSLDKLLDSECVRKLSHDWSRESSLRRRRSSDTPRMSASPPPVPVPHGRVKQLSQEFSFRMRAVEASVQRVRARTPERSPAPVRKRSASSAVFPSTSQRRRPRP